jgi:hypothetical protein
MSHNTCVIVAPHFPPSNLAGVHRARLLAQHLEEFGWRPVVVTTHWAFYEEELDWGLHSLVDPGLEVVRTPALGTRPIRIVGDIGIRALPWHLAALQRLRDLGKMDFLLITIPSFYSGILGELLYRRKPLPFGIDYIDPWVYQLPRHVPVVSKEALSMAIHRRLEPFGIRRASLITGVAPGYFEGALTRSPHVRSQAVLASAPYGFSERDFSAAALASERATLFDPADGNFHFVYAGALLPRAHGILRRLFEGLIALRDRDPSALSRLQFHFIGTGRAPNDPQGSQVLPYAREIGVDSLVTEHPHRMSYLRVLRHLASASAVLIVGSTERHYTPSKVFQAVQARRPVLALLHEQSSAVAILRSSKAGVALTLREDALPEPRAVASAILETMSMAYDPAAVDWGAFEQFSARRSAAVLASAMDEALERFRHRLAVGEGRNPS